MPLLLTQQTAPQSPPIYTPEALHMASPCLHIDVIAATNLARKDNLPEVYLTSAIYALFSVYQDCVHQNTGIHLNGEIGKDGKWQVRWENLLV